MSNIRSLYTALAGINITFTTEAGSNATPVAYDLNSLPRGIKTGHLPCRLLLPTEEWEGGGGLEIMSMGTATASGEMVWNVTDLMLWKAVGQGRGLMDALPDLVRYAGAYVEALIQNRNITPNTRLRSLNVRPGVFQYPLGSNSHFFGVEVNLTFAELINP